MSVAIYLFCKKKIRVDPEQIEEFFEDGGYWDSNPRYDLKKYPSKSFQLQVRYKPKKKPVVISFYSNSDSTFLETKDEILSVFDDEPVTSSSKKISNWIRNSVQMYVMEVDPVSIEEEDWLAVDSLEAFIAKITDAILYSSGEFFEVKDSIRKIYTFKNGSY